MKKFILSILITFIIGLETTASVYAQNKVVVVPLAADTIDPKLLPIVNAVITAEGLSAGFGVRQVTHSAQTGVYELILEESPGSRLPIVQITVFGGEGKIASYEVGDFINLINVTITEADGTTKVDSSFSITVFSNPL